MIIMTFGVIAIVDCGVKCEYGDFEEGTAAYIKPFNVDFSHMQIGDSKLLKEPEGRMLRVSFDGKLDYLLHFKEVTNNSMVLIIK